MQKQSLAPFAKALLGLFIFTLSIPGYGKNQCPYGHWREIAYDTKIMAKYKPYRNCVAWVSYQFKLPEELMYSILYHERGSVTGRCSTNPNGTQDCGPSGINDVRIASLADFDLTKDDIKNVPCRAIWASGYFMRNEITKANNDFWLGVGNYHYQQKVGPKTHAIYVRHIYDAWRKLVASIPPC